MKCRTYVPEKDFVDHSLNRRQTYNPTEQRQIVFVDKGQYPNGWNENIMKGDNSPIIFTDKAPITINYRGGHIGPERPPNGFRNSPPTTVTSQGNVTVNYDDSQEDVALQQSNLQDICVLTNTMVELPSGIVMPYLKFKSICSPYLPAEDLKSADIRVILDNRNMTYKRFQETLRYYGCGDLGQHSPRPTEIGLANYVTLANGTLKVKTDDYRNIVRSIISGSETLMVPNVVNGKYALYRSLIADELPELIESTFVITHHEGIVVPFSLYYAVDREHFQRPTTAAAVVPKVRQIKWRDGKLVDVQTVRHVIDALRTPSFISFVFPNGKRMPFVRCNGEDPTGLYDYDPEKVLVDVGQCNDVLLSHFNDILSAVHISDDGKHKRFNHPAVFALDPKCLQNTVICAAQPARDGKACKCVNVIDDRKYSGYSIHAINKDKPFVEDKPADQKLTVFGPVSPMEKTTGLDSNDTIRIILTSSSGTHEIKITNVLNNKKPLIYDITDKPIDVRDLTKNMPLNECDYSPVYLMNKTNISCNVTEPVDLQNNKNCTNILKDNAECNCKPILKNNETNVMCDIKNTPNDEPTNSLCSNESTKNQTITGCNENPTTNNNQNHTTTDTVITTTIVTQNNTELMNTSNNHRACGQTNNITTIETKNNSTENPDCSDKCSENQQNSSTPITECNQIPIVKSDNDQTEIKNTTVSSTPNPNTTDPINNTTASTTNPNQKTMTSNRQNSLNTVTEHEEVPEKNDNNQSQTENKNITTRPNSNSKNTSNSNITNIDKNYEPNNTSDNTVKMETSNNNVTDPNHTVVGSGSNETPSFDNSVDTTQTSGATRSSDAADDVGPVEDPKTIPETDIGVDDDTSADAYNTTMDGNTDTNQPTPIYTKTIENPNNGSVSNNATKIINIIVY